MAHPHPMFKLHSPDTVAECWNGVVVGDDWSLYKALWSSLDGEKPLSELIDIEESCPADALGMNCVASLWHKFTPEHQGRLNALADRGGF